jgi:hypothetical protein
VEKHGRAGETTGDNMAHTNLMLVTLGYKRTLVAFPLQQWLQERALILHYTYIACIVILLIGSLIYFDSRC